MQIELEHIRYAEFKERGAVQFSAHICIDGIKAAWVGNSGVPGSPTTIFAFDDTGLRLIKEATTYCESLPPKTRTSHGAKGKTIRNIKISLASFVEGLIEEHILVKTIERQKEKQSREMATGILYGKPGLNGRYTFLDLKMPIDQILESPGRSGALRHILEDIILPSMQEGDKILNTNITPEEQLGLGIPPGRIIKPPRNIIRQPKKKPLPAPAPPGRRARGIN